MTDADGILVKALASTDALFYPIRNWSGNSSANRMLGRERLKSHGVPIKAGGEDANRKAGSRGLADLARQGLVAVRRRSGEMFPYVKLTMRGEARARVVAGLPGRDVALLFIRAIAEREAPYPDTIGGRWVPEVALTDGRGWGADAPREDRQELGLIELDFLAAAFAGWADAHSSCHGNVAYRLTAAGRDELAKPSKAPDVGELPGRSDDDAVDLYEAERDARLNELHSAKPRKPGEIGPHPLVHCLIGYRPRPGATTT